MRIVLAEVIRADQKGRSECELYIKVVKVVKVSDVHQIQLDGMAPEKEGFVCQHASILEGQS